MDNETKEMFEKIISKLDKLEGDVSDLKGDVSDLKGDVSDLKGDVSDLKGDVSDLKGDVSDLKVGQESIKQHITGNNVAIGEIFTKALERSDSKVSQIAEITKDNLFEIALLKQAK